MVPQTNAPEQQSSHSAVPPIKATCDGDKFEKFELLKERFKCAGDKHVQLTTDDVNEEVIEITIDHEDEESTEDQLSEQIQHQIAASIAFMTVETDLKEIRNFLRTTRKRMETKATKAKVVDDWKQVALVLDRTFFFIYLTAIIICLAVMFPR